MDAVAIVIDISIEAQVEECRGAPSAVGGQAVAMRRAEIVWRAVGYHPADVGIDAVGDIGEPFNLARRQLSVQVGTDASIAHIFAPSSLGAVYVTLRKIVVANTIAVLAISAELRQVVRVGVLHTQCVVEFQVVHLLSPIGQMD